MSALLYTPCIQLCDRPLRLPQCTVSEFLCQPTAARLLGLGDQRQELLTKEARNVQVRTEAAASRARCRRCVPCTAAAVAVTAGGRRYLASH